MVLTIGRISSVEYYLEASNQDRDRTQYYTDAADEPPGQWYSPTGWLRSDMATVSPGDLRRIAAGFDPSGGPRLVQSNVKTRRAAYDLTFSVPKAVSTIWATGTEGQRKMIEASHAAAVRATLDKIIEMTLIETRRGKAGAIKEVPQDLLAAIYDHHGTRAGDPQIHSHVLLMNLCTRSDGTTGAIDSAKLGPMLKSMGAFYRSTLAQNLQAQGFRLRQENDAFTIDCVPDQLIEKWSKRRADIVGAANKAGFTTSEDRRAAQLINLQTRKAKAQVPSRRQMEETWAAEMAELGLSGEQIWHDALSAAKADRKELPLPEQEADQCVGEAIAELFETEAVIESRKILELSLIKSQGRCPPDLIWQALAAAETNGTIIRLNPNDQDGEPIFSTPAIIQAEKDIIEIAQRRQDERMFVPGHLIDRAIRATNRGSFKLTDEQEAAVKHALGRDAVSIIDGKAGTGKSSVFKTLHDAAADAGEDIHLLAPSWKATSGTAADLSRIRKEQARAVAGFLTKTERGNIKISRRSLILVDEAGMLSTMQMHRLLKAADKAGAKVVLAGDSQQLAAVQAGDPLSLLIRRIGAAKIDKIIRQKEPWLAECSEKFATGNEKAIKEAINTYYERGHIMLTDNREDATNRLAESWLESAKAGAEIGVLASRNDDVRELNDRIRSKAIEAGLIKGPAISVEATGRGKNAKAEPLTIAKGDRLLLGEGLKLAGKDVSNTSILTVISIQPGPPTKLTVRLEDRTVITISAADLTGPKGRPVRMAYGWATTIHASQGATHDKTLVFDAANLKSRAAYVAMTRHREDVRVFIDGAAIEAKAATRKVDERTLFAGAGGLAGFADEDQEDVLISVELSESDKINFLSATWSAADKKANAHDYLAQPAAKFEPETEEADPDGDETDDDVDDQLRQSHAARPVPPMAKPQTFDRPRP